MWKHPANLQHARLCLFCLYMLCQNSLSTGNAVPKRTNREVLEREAPSEL
ncbi:hypothetical protein YC2023_070323 [Brassica napus]